MINVREQIRDCNFKQIGQEVSGKVWDQVNTQVDRPIWDITGTQIGIPLYEKVNDYD